MPFPEGVAAMARPALRAPPGRHKAFASAPYVKTLPRGICCTKRNTGSQDISNQAPSRDRNQLARHRRRLSTREQEKNAAAGFNAVAGRRGQFKKRQGTASI